MDFSKLSQNQKIVAGSGLVLLLSSFFPWRGVSVIGIEVTKNAWGSGLFGWGAVLLGVAAAAIVVMQATGQRDVAAGPFGPEKLGVYLGGLAVVFIVLRMLINEDLVGPKWGVFLALIAAAGITYGALMNAKDAGVAVNIGDDFKSVTGGDEDGDNS